MKCTKIDWRKSFGDTHEEKIEGILIAPREIKIAFEHGMATDVNTTKHTGMVMIFWPADPKYKAPSSEICKTRWRDVKKISDKDYAGPPLYRLGREVDNTKKNIIA